MRAPDVDAQLAGLKAIDPEFTRDAFCARVERVYHELNAAWSSLAWQDARPYLSDRLWYGMRYWIHAYEEQGLQNLMLAAKLHKQKIAKITSDPFYFSITVRIWASAIDETIVRATGTHVGGDPHRPRQYSEYWTFIRSATRKGAPQSDKNCPNCGAGLALDMAGNCGHCRVKITGGAFDWVLSKIEQDEVYAG